MQKDEPLRYHNKQHECLLRAGLKLKIFLSLENGQRYTWVFVYDCLLVAPGMKIIWKYCKKIIFCKSPI